MPPDNNQTTQRSVHGNKIPSIGRIEKPYLLAGTPDTGCALRGATHQATTWPETVPTLFYAGAAWPA
jgi:hypothetical protein